MAPQQREERATILVVPAPDDSVYRNQSRDGPEARDEWQDQECQAENGHDGEDEDDSSTRLTAEDAWLFPLVRQFILYYVYAF